MRQKEKERIEQVVLLQNGTGIIAGENSYIIKEKGKEEKGSGHYSSHFPFFINTLYYQTYNTGGHIT